MNEAVDLEKILNGTGSKVSWTGPRELSIQTRISNVAFVFDLADRLIRVETPEDADPGETQVTQLWLLNPDPDWHGNLPKPEGAGWIWTKSSRDIHLRFPGYQDLEIVAGPNPRLRDAGIREKLYQWGPYRQFGLFDFGGWLSSGNGHFFDVQSRGGAWVRRIES